MKGRWEGVKSKPTNLIKHVRLANFDFLRVNQYFKIKRNPVSFFTILPGSKNFAIPQRYNIKRCGRNAQYRRRCNQLLFS